MRSSFDIPASCYLVREVGVEIVRSGRVGQIGGAGDVARLPSRSSLTTDASEGWKASAERFAQNDAPPPAPPERPPSKPDGGGSACDAGAFGWNAADAALRSVSIALSLLSTL